MSTQKRSARRAAWNRDRRASRNAPHSKIRPANAPRQSKFTPLSICIDDAEVEAHVQALGQTMPPRVIGRCWMAQFVDGADLLHAVFWCARPGDSGLVMLTYRQPADPLERLMLQADLLALFRENGGHHQ